MTQIPWRTKRADSRKMMTPKAFQPQVCRFRRKIPRRSHKGVEVRP
jgi:hypothetical protein